MTTTDLPGAVHVGPPPGWDPEAAADRIRARARRIAAMHARIEQERPEWTFGHRERVIRWLTREGRRS